MTEPSPNLIDHVIQRDIVKKLTLSGSARFSELKPKNIESNLFMYHLNQLKKRDMVAKNGTTYSLTSVARMYVDRANLEKLVFRVQPKIVSILAIKSSKQNWLLLERTHEPHMNRVGFPSGKLHYGETLEDSAVRELEEKAGLTGVDLTLAGSVAMRFLKGDQVINHTIGNIFTAELASEPDVTVESPFWKSYWGSEAELFGPNTFKGHKDILDLLKSGAVFIQSLDYESDY